eukprot:scaffold126320_cov32-Tisochrysis_lutea.AAC.2
MNSSRRSGCRHSSCPGRRSPHHLSEHSCSVGQCAARGQCPLPEVGKPVMSGNMATVLFLPAYPLQAQPANQPGEHKGEFLQPAHHIHARQQLEAHWVQFDPQALRAPGRRHGARDWRALGLRQRKRRRTQACARTPNASDRSGWPSLRLFR